MRTVAAAVPLVLLLLPLHVHVLKDLAAWGANP